MTPTLDHLITHRFRGFHARENALPGFIAALDFGVRHLEFDIRVTMCGLPIIWHDEYARDKQGQKRMICDTLYRDFQKLGGDFAHFCTFEELLAAAKAHDHKGHLLIDIKDAGFEIEIVSLVKAYGLDHQVTYVSWVPEALFAIYDIEPDAYLCLSHWCKKPGQAISDKHRVYAAKNGVIPRSGKSYIHGERSGWFVDGPLSGEMLAIVTDVCVPRDMVTPELVKFYHTHDIKVSVFSYIDWPSIRRDHDAMKIDLYFIDDKGVFDAL